MRSTELTTPAGLRGSLLDELAACLDRLERLNDADWSRPTRVGGRTVLEVANLATEQLRRLEIELGSGLAVDTPHGPDAADPESAVQGFRAARDAVVETLNSLGDDLDEARLLAAFLTVALAHNDVLHAIGAEQALPDAIATIAAQSIAGILAGQIFNGVTRQPERPVGYRLVAPTASTAVWSAGDGWNLGEDGRLPTCHINADDSSMLLFVTGRISARDLRLWVTGERELVWLFKDYFPGN